MDSYPNDWQERRRQTYQRDEYECQRCGAKGGYQGDTELHAHHQVPKSQGGSHDLGNLQTVCKSCHESIHGHQIPTKGRDDSSQDDGLSAYERRKYLVRRDVSWGEFKRGWKKSSFAEKILGTGELIFGASLLTIPVGVFIYGLLHSIIYTIIIWVPVSIFILWKIFSGPTSAIPYSIIGRNSGVEHPNGKYGAQSAVYECTDCGETTIGNTTVSCSECGGNVVHCGWV